MSRTSQPTENTFNPEPPLLPITNENDPAFDLAGFDSLVPPRLFQHGANPQQGAIFQQESDVGIPNFYFPDFHSPNSYLPNSHQEPDPHQGLNLHQGLDPHQGAVFQQKPDVGIPNFYSLNSYLPNPSQEPRLHFPGLLFDAFATQTPAERDPPNTPNPGFLMGPSLPGHHSSGDPHVQRLDMLLAQCHRPRPEAVKEQSQQASNQTERLEVLVSAVKELQDNVKESNNRTQEVWISVQEWTKKVHEHNELIRESMVTLIDKVQIISQDRED
ncbi:hypothetical protein F5X98DRAFT_359718 [Xylaria grammica]|nr:hypothetical protein F5X98DRAFT_359718 [Xylaria grammica]